MRNELQRHKRSDKVKWVLTGIMFFLAFVMIAGLFLQIFGTGKTKPSEWFKKLDSEQTETLPDEGGENATAYMRVKAMAATFSTESQVRSNMVDYPLSSYFVGNQSSLDYSPAGVISYFSDFRGDKSTTVSVRSDYSTHNVDLSQIAFDCSRKLTELNVSQVPNDKGRIIIYKNGLYRGSTSYEVVRFSVGLGGFSCTWFEYNDCFVSSEITQGFLLNNWGIWVEMYKIKNIVPLPDDPVKEGYNFVGWYYDEAFTRPYEGADIYEDTQLYAKFEIKKFTVSFASDGGSAVESQTVDWNTAATLTTPTKTGYVFKGWYLSDGTQYTNQGVRENITLTAHWEVQTFTVSFYVDGELYATKTVEYGQSLAKVTETENLVMLSVRMESGVPTFDDNGAVIVTENCSVEAQEMSDTDKAINTIKQNKWAIIGGVAGGVALIAVIAAVCGGKRKRKR